MTLSDAARRSGPWALAAAAVAAVLASSCCLIPLLLVSVGFSAGWLADLRALQPYSTILTVVAVGALVIASFYLLRGKAPCVVATDSRAGRYYKPLFWIVALLTLALLIVPLLAPWFY